MWGILQQNSGFAWSRGGGWRSGFAFAKSLARRWTHCWGFGDDAGMASISAATILPIWAAGGRSHSMTAT